MAWMKQTTSASLTLSILSCDCSKSALLDQTICCCLYGCRLALKQAIPRVCVTPFVRATKRDLQRHINAARPTRGNCGVETYVN